jgi:hypothetical protein
VQQIVRLVFTSASVYYNALRALEKLPHAQIGSARNVHATYAGCATITNLECPSLLAYT